MGTIIKRKRKDGTVFWLAQIAVRRAGKTVWRENRTFELRSTAAAWIEKRAKDLAKPGALENLPIAETRRREVTLGGDIDKYVEDSAKAIGRTKAQVLKSINGFYNPRRRHSALGWKSPLVFEGRVNENPERHKSVTGPPRPKRIFFAQGLHQARRKEHLR